jgi:pimeloyl-[acyl-carrier protein] methyl ester esterase
VKPRVEVLGSGPPLVMLHGWGLHSGVWAPLEELLAGHFQLLLVDLPGHGRSPAPAPDAGLGQLAESVAAVAPPGAAWLGWSLGGQVALAAALAGHDIGQLVLVATTPRFVAGPDWPCGLAESTLADFASALERDHDRCVRDFLTLQLRGDRRAATLLGMLRKLLAERAAPDTAALVAGLRILGSTDLRGQLGGIGQPALVVAGERDRLTPPEASRRLAAALPQGQLTLFQGAAHAPFLTHPELFFEAVTSFLLPGEAAA